MRRITIRLLGSFEAIIDGAPVTFPYAKVRALLAYLAVEGGRAHSRAELATLLWPEQPEQAARASLSQALMTLRNALGDKNAERPALLSDVGSVRLDPDCAVDVDVSRVLALLWTSEEHTHRSWRTCAACFERLRQALALYRGAFLADVAIPDSALFEDWATAQREHLVQRVLSALGRLVERAQWRGAYAQALQFAHRLVALDPLLEANQRTYLRLLALNGETTAALAHSTQLTALLANELAVEPEDATTALVEQIRRGATTPLAPPEPPFVVPVAPSPLIGRADELEALCARLRELPARCLTLTGAGGIGKTRLALEAAHALRYEYEDGVYMVELAALTDAALVADTIARVLGVQERAQQRIGDTLRDALRSKQLLLVLDNFEHVVSAAPLVGGLLAACPALTVLVTSRAPLQIRAEQQVVLDALADQDAVALFVERAQAVGAELPIDEAGTTVYAAICGRLDRLPLAIELIAVRARTRSPLELLHELEQPLEALARGPRDVSARHQSLRQAIAWSYDLLSAEDQRVFRHLGVFAGGWSAEAAQAVLGSASAVLPALETLHQASLVRQQVVAEQTRLGMLETIREFALEQLMVCGEAASAQQRHAEYFADFSMTADVELLRAEATRWRAWVAAEQDNLRAAFGWVLKHRMHEAALRIATGVWRFHWMCGYLRDGLERLETALVYREQASLDVQANALRAAGMLAIGLSDYPRGRRWLEAGVQVGWRMNDQTTLQRLLTNLGFALLEQGELEEARIQLEVSLSLARQGKDPTVAKFPLGILANLHLRLGDYAQARALREESLRINQDCRDTEGTADALRGLAEIVNAQGDVLRAQQMGEQALALHGSLHHQLGMGLDYAVMGDIARGRGDDAAALAHYQQSLSLWRDRENLVNSSVVFDRLARTLCRIGDPESGATLSGTASAIRERAGVKLTADEQASNDETMRACRLALGEAAVTAWSAGRALTLAQAINLALKSSTAAAALA